MFPRADSAEYHQEEEVTHWERCNGEWNTSGGEYEVKEYWNVLEEGERRRVLTFAMLSERKTMGNNRAGSVKLFSEGGKYDYYLKEGG